MTIEWEYVAIIAFIVMLFGGMAFKQWAESKTEQSRYDAYTACVKSNQENCNSILGK